ncbi:hypothetical protein B0J11DRAFT_292115 [Dendryphion nanum]|uniref:Uncharacterized protein n=1 Tax=Dendryphion nanum TaxID=256645 RepID=A0A9P9IPZ6_9PLEO|nr:hypothetical protein B0J11DRAFT_292115 [Dendryphion nanum]
MQNFMVLAIIPTLLAIVGAENCYFPNGNTVPSDHACNPNALVSACCFDGQACLSNGLCASNPNDETLKRFHRGTCTDKAWKSGNCPRQCLDIPGNGVNVYSCNQTNIDSYCCYDNCECTSRSEVFSFPEVNVWTVTIIGDRSFIPQTAPPSPQSTSTSISTSTMTVISATTRISEATGLAETQNASLNKTALGVGTGVGLGGAAFLCAGVLFLLWRRQKQKVLRASAYGTHTHPVELGTDTYPLEPAAPKYSYYAGYFGKDIESTLISELPTAQLHPVELPLNTLAKQAVPRNLV